MKIKTIVSILLLLISTYLFSQQTYVPDDNFEQALIDLGYDTVLDDYVTTANINTVPYLNLGTSNISDLSGIEDFVALLQLHVGYNNLTSLDVSNNVFLVELSCNGNSLTSLDVSSNTALGILFINETNISSIDLSTNTSLNWLDCSSTSLNSLDLSNNTNLFRLYCQNTTLNTLDLSNNSALSELYCANNPNLNSLNVKNGNNTIITVFNATNNPNLTCIEVDDETYSNMNWPDKDVTAVYSVDCASLGISEVEDFSFRFYPNPTKTQFTIQLENNTELKNVTIYNNLGQEVLNSKKSVVNTSKLASGLYVVEIETNKGKGTKKLIIE